jgi:hypothetical protein
VKLLAQPGHFSAVIQMIDAENYLNKRIRFSAMLKTEAVSPRAMLCIHYGIGLMGPGQIWLDHLTFETVGTEVSVTTRS